MSHPVVETVKQLFSTVPGLTPKLEQERRASVFGMVESGKTTILGLLEIVCVDYANKANAPKSKEKFHFLVQERTSGIRQVARELREGMFPEKTPPDHIFEADFLMRFDSALGKRHLRLPFCETAGETFTKLLERFGKGQYQINPHSDDADLIHDYILDTDAIVLIVPVPRLLGFEREIGAKLQLPDVNLSRLLSAIYEYKELDARQNPYHKPIKGITVFLTKYDAAKTQLETGQMNLNTPQGVHEFMSNYMQETYSVLGWYGLDIVRFWTTGLTIEQQIIETNEIDELGRPIRKRVGKLHPFRPDRGYQIKVNYHRNRPEGDYEESMLEFIEWLKDTVMA